MFITVATVTPTKVSRTRSRAKARASSMGSASGAIWVATIMVTTQDIAQESCMLRRLHR